MPEFKCEACNLAFKRKQHLLEHVKTKRHANIVSSALNLTLNSAINAVKQESKSEIEFFKKQLEVQNTILSKFASFNNPNVADILPIDYVIETYKDAINFEDLFAILEPYLCNPQMNKWITIGGDEYDMYMCLKYIEVGYYPKTEEFMTDMFCNVLNQIEHTKKPIYCANKSDGIYYYKTNDKWEEISKTMLLKKIHSKLTSFINSAIINTKTYSKDYPVEFKKQYGKDGDWLMRNGGELALTTWVGAELDKFINVCHKKLSAITMKEKKELEESKPHHWKEYDDVPATIDSDSD